MNGKRLERARFATGLSLHALSDAIDSKASAREIGKYERNENGPDSDVLIALAHVLDVPVEFLLSDDIGIEDIKFRKSAGLSARRMARIEARVLNRVEKYLTIEGIHGLSGKNEVKWKELSYHVEDLDDAEAAAQELRGIWNLGMGPIPGFSELLEDRGIKVISLDIARVDGLVAKIRRKGEHDSFWSIMVRSSAWSARKRFTLAHELGHVVLDIAPRCDAEKAVNRFAGAFLIPEKVLRENVLRENNRIGDVDGGFGQLVRMRNHFGMSVPALIYRCRDIEIVSAADFNRLFQIYRNQDWNGEPYKETAEISQNLEKSDRFERLCLDALSKRLIGFSLASELLEVPIRSLMNAP